MNATSETDFDLYTAWLQTQPADAELNRLELAVKVAEDDLNHLRARIPEMVTYRAAAAEKEDGGAYNTADAALFGLPRRVARAAGIRVVATLRYLARLSALATRAAAEAERRQDAFNAELKPVRRQIVKHEGTSVQNPEHRLTPGEVSGLNANLSQPPVRLNLCEQPSGKRGKWRTLVVPAPGSLLALNLLTSHCRELSSRSP